MKTKFNLDAAWGRALEYLSANRAILPVLAGLFFFLPQVALSYGAPPPETPTGADPERVFEELQLWFRGVWPYYLLLSIVSMVGTLAMVALFTDPSRPTVGEALARGAKAVPSYLAAFLIGVLALCIVLGIFIGLVGATGIAPLVVLAIIFSVAIMAYFYVKIALLAPVVVTERELNPLAALKRSWTLTKGNSLRIFTFLLLIGIVYFVVSAIVTALGSGIGGLGGPQAALFIGALLSGLAAAIFQTVLAAIYAAIHRQLSGPAADESGKVFE